ncbi:MAG: HD domain-containing protein [Chloroflexi bacterium]|nr:HD domain-containing protein [Chloroflexota bacterium]
MNLDDIERMTSEHGEGWGYAHVRRVLNLIGHIGKDTPHDPMLVTYATFLHDWGAFPAFRQLGVDHALRSRQIAAEQVLPHTGLSPSQATLVLDAIERHDYRDTRPALSNEGLLLREADCIDFLGMIGIAREFAWGPNNLRTCYERILSRCNGIRGSLTLPLAQTIANERIAEMEHALNQLVAESFGYL